MAKDARKLAARSYKSLRGIIAKGGALKAHHAVHIEWEDHTSFHHGWQSLKKVRKTVLANTLCSSVGYPVHVDDNCVVLAQTSCESEVADLMKIMLHDIRSITKLGKRKKER